VLYFHPIKLPGGQYLTYKFIKMNSTVKTKLLFIVSLLFGLVFINAGLSKFFNYMPAPENLPAKFLKAMAAVAAIGWLMPLIGVAEIVGGILIIIPRTRALGALIIFPVMAGIFLTTIVQDTSGLPVSIILFAILIWIMYDNRKRYLPLIQENQPEK
jgi:uncharacterized membrane protein YphA (DoxX/SURF4 family)